MTCHGCKKKDSECVTINGTNICQNCFETMLYGKQSRQIDVPLRAVTQEGHNVSSQNWDWRTDFVNRDKELIVTEYEDGKGVVVKTPLGEYQLLKHATMNSYMGSCGEHKVRVVLKKMVGTLSYWA